MDKMTVLQLIAPPKVGMSFGRRGRGRGRGRVLVVIISNLSLCNITYHPTIINKKITCRHLYFEVAV